MAQEISCCITALSTGERKKREELFAALARRIEGFEETESGYCFRLGSAPVWLEVARFVDLERRCCPFFHFRLERDPEDRISLGLGGSPEAKVLLADIFEEWMRN